MKKNNTVLRIIIILIILVIIFILIYKFLLPKTATPVVYDMNMVTAPQKDAPVIMLLDEGTELEFIETGDDNNGYAFVRIPGTYITGYVHRQAVKENKLALLQTSILDAAPENPSPHPLTPSFTDYMGNKSTCRIIENYAFTCCMDTALNLPHWVSHTIDDELVEAGELSRERPNGYARDRSYDAIKKNAYASSGYDHGHLAPARDFKWNEQAWDESFYMTNMAPQYGCMNQKGWCHLESHVRAWATESDNVFFVVSGIIPGEYIDTLCLSKIQIPVPARFFKVVLSYDPDGTESKAIGFIVPNADVQNEEIPGMAVPIDEIEKLTDLDFFMFLPSGTEAMLESDISSFNWYDVLDCPDKDCDKVYSRRKEPEERTVLNCPE